MLVKSLAALSGLSATLASFHYEISSDGTSGSVSLSGDFSGFDVAEVAAENDTTPAWPCDIRVWTRAPDLTPDTVLPADARLAANGSACGEITKWEVGMRLKERALIKKRANDVEFPKKPIRPQWNASRWVQDDYNDVYKSHLSFRHNDPAEKEYEDAMEVYEMQMSNASLWFVSGQERVVFDLTREMALKPANSELIELTESFAIHMPNTNFPPIERSFSYINGQDDQSLLTETMSEFYHLLTLANGTVLDIPSGEIGIIPANTAVRASSETQRSPIGDIEWPQTVEFSTTSHNASEFENDDPYFGSFYGPVAPACDDGNLAIFTLSVNSNVTQPTIGQNITLNFTLTRTGNGSEYPAYLEVAHASDRNITWGYQYVANETEYESLVGQSGRTDRFIMFGGPNIEIKRASTAKELLREKERTERRLDRDGFIEYSGGRFGSRQAKHEMWEEDEEPKEVYTFGVEVALSERDMPSFEKTFEVLRSSLAFTLHTYFTCDARNIEDDVPCASCEGSSEDIPKLDKEWDEYELPTRKSKRASIARSGRTYQHTQSMPFDAGMPSESLLEGVGLSHYKDVWAHCPVLSSSVSDEVVYKQLDQTIREETEDERKRQRWGYAMGMGRYRGWCQREGAPNACHRMNGGGGSMLASRMWQSKEAKMKEAEEAKEVGEGGKASEKASFVVQG